MTSGLAVGNLGLTNVSVNLELAEQTVDDDLEVQLAHASDDGLAGLVVGGHLEVGSSSASLVRARDILSCSALVLGSMAMSITGISELHGLKDDRASSEHRVSPVEESFQAHDRRRCRQRKHGVTMSTRWLECICSRRPNTRSFCPLVALTT